MRRTFLLVAYIAIVLIALTQSLFDFSNASLEQWETIAFFSLLVLLVAFLRVRSRDNYVGFEGAVAFPAVILFHQPPYAFLPVFFGTLVFDLLAGLREKRLRSFVISDAAQSSIAYYFGAWLFVLTIDREAVMRAKIPGYFLLAGAFLAVRLLFVLVEQYFSGSDYRVAVAHLVSGLWKSLLLITPIVAVEVLVYPTYGKWGFLIAFFPVLLVAYVMRNESRAELQNAQLTRRNRELSLLSESAVDIFSTDNDEQTISKMIRVLAEIVPMQACAVVAWPPYPDVAGTVYRFGDCRASDQAIIKWVEDAGLDHAAPRQAILMPGAGRKLSLSGERSAFQYIAGLQTVEVIYGMLIFETDDRLIAESDTQGLFKLVVSQTALSLQDQLLKREMQEKNTLLEKQATTLSTILGVSNSLIGAVDVRHVFTSISDAIRSSLDLNDVMFALYDPATDEFVRSARGGTEETWIRRNDSRAAGEKIRELLVDEYRMSNSYFMPRGELRRRDVELFIPNPQWDPEGLDVIVVPLAAEKTVFGYLALTRNREAKVITLDQLQLLEIYANQAVTALQTARQYEEIKRLTVIDALTPAYNHRYFQEALDKEVHRADRKSRNFALAMIDIDSFKTFNDTYGHQVGDEILKELVRILLDHVRDMDTVARYGGEEFAIIFPELSAPEALIVADRLRAVVAEKEFVALPLTYPLHITLSVGVAVFPDDGTTASRLISRADAALYVAKKNGKNQVCLATESVAS